jgi:hypothetical protein
VLVVAAGVVVVGLLASLIILTSPRSGGTEEAVRLVLDAPVRQGKCEEVIPKYQRYCDLAFGLTQEEQDLVCDEVRLRPDEFWEATARDLGRPSGSLTVEDMFPVDHLC